MNKRIKLALAGTVTALAVAGGSLAAVAATSTPTPLAPNKLCYNAGGNVLAVHSVCPPKYKTYTLAVGQRGPKGATGARGVTGKTGPQGIQGVQGQPGTNGKDGKNGNGVVWHGTENLLSLSGPESIATGGGFVANSTLVGTITFASAGYWDIQISAQTTPKASGDTSQVFPQLFLYNQPKSSSFAGDVLNMSTEDQPDGTNHNSYLNGGITVFVPAPATKYYVYAFGYDGDMGAGSYTLNYVNMTYTEFASAS